MLSEMKMYNDKTFKISWLEDDNAEENDIIEYKSSANLLDDLLSRKTTLIDAL